MDRFTYPVTTCDQKTHLFGPDILPDVLVQTFCETIKQECPPLGQAVPLQCLPSYLGRPPSPHTADIPIVDDAFLVPN